MPLILVVDDDEDIRFVVSATLEEFGGYRVIATGSGQEATELMRTQRPDLVLMDVQMPGLDGPRTLERIRADESIRDLTVAFMTANGEPADLRRYQALGAAGVIRKPFDPRALLEQVAIMIKGRRPNRTPPGGTPRTS